MGWTGDLQVFAPTACFLYDTAGFLDSWLADLASEQAARGGVVPNVIPDCLPELKATDKHDWFAPAAGWGDAAVVVPWIAYQRTGDKGVLARQFGSMTAWVDTIAELAGEDHLWNTGFQFGDWLDPAAPPENPERGKTDPGLVATAYLARSAEIVADAAVVLGRTDDALRYSRIADATRAAWVAAYSKDDGLLTSDSQTAYALALEFGLLTDTQARARAGMRLADLARDDGYRVGTGFLGTPLICDALCSAGDLEVAYRLLLERECPSWLYPVTVGATTIWERWDSMLADGSVNTGEMTSFNHYALGAIADWLHRTVAGLSPGAPGYRRIEVHPRPGGGLTYAHARHRTPYGIAEVSWRLLGDELEVEAVVPPNTEATVTKPDGTTFDVGSGRYSWKFPNAPAPALN
jgi:alpha-L-rhamnosidase